MAGDPRASAASHPANPVLVVEIAEASLALDREHKSGLYARAGVADYWIVNLVDQQIEVYREPVVAALTPLGWRYRRREVLGAGVSVSALAALSAPIAVADLLP